jgi:hypothetical protein
MSGVDINQSGNSVIEYVYGYERSDGQGWHYIKISGHAEFADHIRDIEANRPDIDTSKIQIFMRVRSVSDWQQLDRIQN